MGVRERIQSCFMGSWYSKQLTGKNDYFLSLKALNGGGFSFGYGKEVYILGFGNMKKWLNHVIEDIYYVSRLKYNLLSMS